MAVAKKPTTSEPIPITDSRPIPVEFKRHLKVFVKQFSDATPREELAAATEAYILQGEGADVLLKLGADKSLGQEIALPGVNFNLPWDKTNHLIEQRGKLFDACQNAPIPVLIRLGEVLETISRAAGHKLTPFAKEPLWLVAFLGNLVNTAYRVRSTMKHDLPFAQLQAIFAAAGLTELHLAQFLLAEEFKNHLNTLGFYFYQETSQVFPGGDQFLNSKPELVRQALQTGNAQHLVQSLGHLSKLKYDFTAVAPELAALACGPQKTVREAAEPICREVASAVTPHIETLLREGDAGQRYEAVGLLYQLHGEAALGTLKAQHAVEKSEKIRLAIEKRLAAPQEDHACEWKIDFPPVNVKLGKMPLGEPAKAAIRAYFDKCHADAMRHYEQQLKQWQSPDRPKWMTKPAKPDPLPEKARTELIEFLEGTRDSLGKNRVYSVPFSWGKPIVDSSFAPPNAELVHIVRLAIALHDLSPDENENNLSWHDTADLEMYRGLCQPPFGLRELDAVIAAQPGFQSGMLLRNYLELNTKYHEFCNWEPEAIWPAFAEQLDLLRGSLSGALSIGRNDYRDPDRRRNAYRVLNMFPQLPPGFLNLLWDIALGDSKVERPLAQKALEQVPGKAKKVAVALADGRQQIRQAAADWLAAIGDASVLDDLKAAFAKEKQEAVKGAMMTALEKCGGDVSEFLDRDKLLAEAEAGLKKTPSSLSWFPFDSLPKVHWADNGNPVESSVLKWWIVQAVVQKSPVPGPLVRRYLQMCKPADLDALSKFIVTTWISYDTRTANPEEARERAKRDAASQWKSYGKYKWFVDQYKSEQALQEHLFREYSGKLIGSASGERGMLAIAAINTPVDCIRACENYIKKWFGQRLAQCKALVEFLSVVQHPMALQVLLGIANRFRTKAIRELAQQLVNSIAEREGWTLDQLADRTIPDAGFTKPEGGGEATLTIDYGPRRFTVKLDDDLEPIIVGDNGKVIKSLPAPGKHDNSELAKESKKLFSDAKKQVKDVIKRQRERLYEALCVQRGWPYSEWKTYLYDHAVMSRLCVRVVWAAFQPGENGKLIGCFRPLEDGSFTNETDDTVSFPEDCFIRVAHAAMVSKEVAQAWAKHLQDYDVQVLFPQFGRDPYTLPEAKHKDKELKDFEGHVLRTFSLRGKASKLGYVRGEAEDGGWFRCYRKPFPSLLIEAEIEFTGSPLPEEDIPCALQSLRFYRMSTNENASRWNRVALELGKVPAVLLSECFNDYQQLAAEGTGYDPEWQKVSYY